MIAEIEKLGKTLLEAVELHQKTQEELRELHSYQQNKATLEKELEVKHQLSKDLDYQVQQLRAQISKDKAAHETYREKTIQQSKVEIEAQRSDLVREYQRVAKELEGAKDKLAKEIAGLTVRRDDLQGVVDKLQERKREILASLEA